MNTRNATWIGLPSLLAGLLSCARPPGGSADKGPAVLVEDSGEPGGDSAAEDAEVDPCASLQARPSASYAEGRRPFRVELDGSMSCGPSEIIDWSWEIEGQTYGGPGQTWTGLREGPVEAVLRVTDAAGAQHSSSLTLLVTPDVCPAVLGGVPLGDLADAALTEASGLIQSARDPDLLWSHNDSGDHARIFALGRDGSALGTYTFDLPDSDWEDLGAGLDPDTGATVLFIGDIGNNDLSRTSVAVYLALEPTVDRGAPAVEQPLALQATLTLTLPEPLNLDSLLVDPQTQDLYLFSDAADGRTVVLRKAAPHVDGEVSALEVVGELTLGVEPFLGDTLATGAAISPLGERVLLRTRQGAFLWLRDGAQSVGEALAGEPCAVALPSQPLGEAITFDAEQGGLLTVSEGAGEPVIWVPFEEPVDCHGEVVAAITADPPGGPLPLTITFGLDEACAPAGDVDAAWTIEGEDETRMGAEVSATFLASGDYDVGLVLTDARGDVHEASMTVHVEPPDCPTIGSPAVLGTVAESTLTELSGVVTGRANPDLLWVHNDSGHDPELFALDRSGATVARYTLDLPVGDFEDIAAGYAEDGTPELWLGVIGDNEHDKPNILIYRLDEPVVTGESATLSTFDTLTLTYPEGSLNAETLLVDPRTRDLFIVTKATDGRSGIYRKSAPHSDGEVAVLEKVGELAFGEGALAGSKLTTAGDISPDGAWIVVRTYATTAYLWRRDGDTSVAEAFATDPCPLTMPTERQGEAIGFDVDGQALISISEGTAMPINWAPLTRDP